MNDVRLSPPPEEVVTSEAASICVPMVDLTRGPDGPRDRQLLFGDDVTILNRKSGHCLIRALKDGYCGTVPLSSVAAPQVATHKVTARSTHVYAAPDIKTPDRLTLSFGARLAALSETATFIETDLGFVPRQHLHRADVLASDPAAVAELFLGTPYLWGGNSFTGIDCSGLVQAACLACGISCPGDSDLQSQILGDLLPEDTPLQRNDLIFWKGHVALVCDESTIIHASGGHMATVFEPIEDAIRRIAQQGNGSPSGRRRLPAI